MRFLLVLAFAAMACAGTILPTENLVARPMTNKIDEYVTDLLGNDSEIEYVVDPEDGTVKIAPQFIVSWQVRRFIRKLQKQMPCGWPQYGIPPLAPFRKDKINMYLNKEHFETFDFLWRFMIAGLDNFQINKFKMNVITSKITFDFTFKNIDATAQRYITDTIVNFMDELGLTVKYEGDGNLGFGLKNLRLAGVLKYKIPILWGSIKITSLKTTVSLEKCTSEINGFMGNGKINRFINTQIENVVEMGINNNQATISNMIEDTLVPKVNKLLKGNDFWTIIDMIFSSSEGENEDDPIVVKCVAPANPWA